MPDTDTTPAALDLAALYSALDSASNVLALSSRDWSRTADDAWLYGILCGWDKEPADDGEGNALDELSARYGWDADRVALLKALRAAIEGLTINAIADAMGQAAEVERLRDLVEDIIGEKFREKAELRAEVERLGARVAELEDALTRAENEVEALTP